MLKPGTTHKTSRAASTASLVVIFALSACSASTQTRGSANPDAKSPTPSTASPAEQDSAFPLTSPGSDAEKYLRQLSKVCRQANTDLLAGQAGDAKLDPKLVMAQIDNRAGLIDELRRVKGPPPIAARLERDFFSPSLAVLADARKVSTLALESMSAGTKTLPENLKMQVEQLQKRNVGLADYLRSAGLRDCVIGDS